MPQGIVQRVLGHITEEGVTGLLAELIRRPSVAGTPSDCPVFVARKLQDLGLKVDTYSLEDFRSGTIVYGSLPGKKERPCLMFEGHWDTDPVDATKWTHPPFGGEVVDGYIYGRGTVDSKGALAAQLAAIEAIRKAGVRLNGSLSLLSIGDGEAGFRGGALMADAGIGLRTDWIISGEATSLKTVDVAHSGLIMFKLDVLGRASHPAQPQHGINAILQMGKVLGCLEQVKFRYQPYRYFPDFPRIHVNGIRTQIKSFEVPDECSLLFYVLSVPGMTPESALADIAAHLDGIKAVDKDFDYRLKVLPRAWYYWLPPTEAAPEEPVAKVLQSATRSVTGTEPSLAGFYGVYVTGAMLTAHTSPGELRGRPATVTFGPGEFRRAHTADECVSVKELTDAARIYALTALELLG
ncbi:MAG: M20/M25/M40 family metallo-hydrolase [Chloroflexi bacterium]|nr:M20/M25/M40 family metallo-hydrolase [Chloroflexota bacterium]